MVYFACVLMEGFEGLYGYAIVDQSSSVFFNKNLLRSLHFSAKYNTVLTSGRAGGLGWAQPSQSAKSLISVLRFLLCNNYVLVF